jgi:hypothetical protein
VDTARGSGAARSVKMGGRWALLIGLKWLHKRGRMDAHSTQWIREQVSAILPCTILTIVVVLSLEHFAFGMKTAGRVTFPTRADLAPI